MKVIIAGSRTISDYKLVKDFVDSLDLNIVSIISGTALGVDSLGQRYAEENGIAIQRFPADWKKYGKSAGYRRNVKMAEMADCLIAIRKDNSKGTTHMINIAKKKGITLFVKNIGENK